MLKKKIIELILYLCLFLFTYLPYQECILEGIDIGVVFWIAEMDPIYEGQNSRKEERIQQLCFHT